jgi:STAM-binding protein
MDASGDQRASRPLSVKEIDEQASDYQWNPAIPFKYWVRAAETIYLEVRSSLPNVLYLQSMELCD